MVLAGPAAAHEGHDHDAAASGAASAALAPDGARFAAAGDVFELVGALDGRRLTLWLDRIADTAPVAGATIELDLGARRVTARATGDTYLVELESAPPPGRIAIAATVLAGADSDLLAAELDVPASAGAGGAPAPADASPGPGTAATGRLLPTLGAGEAARLAAVAAIVAAVAATLGWTLGRRRRQSGLGGRP
jgi:hypothetical protein